MQSETPRDRSSLRDMAKLAASMPNPSLPKPNADSSGVVDLEALLKVQPNWVDEAVARAKAGPVVVPEAPPSMSLAPPSLIPMAMDEVPQGVPRNGMAIAAVSGAALVLVGAAVFFAWKTQANASTLAQIARPAPVSVAAAHVEETIPPPPPVAALPATAPAADPATAAQPASAPDTTTAAADDSSDTAPATTRGAGGHSKHVRLHAGRHAAFETAMAPAPAAEPPPAAPAKKGPAPKASSFLDAALSRAAGPMPAAPAAAPVAAPAPAAAASFASDRPARPSGSAVKDALMGVLSAARGCVASESDASKVHVTFGSSGAMKSIDISGPAQSDPHAKLCLNKAFARAHVPAFADPTYSANVTVRP